MTFATRTVQLLSAITFTLVSVSNSTIALAADLQKHPVSNGLEYSSPVYKYAHPGSLASFSAPPSKIVKAKLLMIDTRDQVRCNQIQQELHNSGIKASRQSYEDLCAQNSSSPYTTLTIYEEVPKEQIQNEISLDLLTTDQKNIYSETRNLTIAAAGFLGLLYLMPTSVTKWDKTKDKKGVLESYKENVRNGPVHDQDNWAVNYIGHPVAGAAYYQVARHQGYTPMESFGYSVIMSTFFWEYGIEAFAEVPSIQDLWITPIIGSILGEIFYSLEQKIEAQNGVVLGSKKLGSFVLIVLNPAGALSNQINKIFGSKVIKDSHMSLSPVRRKCDNQTLQTNPGLCKFSGVQLKFEFKF